MNGLMDGFWSTIGVAALCGAIIGLERQLRGKPAGIRTSILICIGTAIFIRLGVEVDSSMGDPARVLAGVIAGIGFIGAGVMMAREGLVMGVTSAAVIWILAGIGAMIGFGEYASGIVLSLVSIVILVGIQFLEQGLRQLRRGGYAHDDNDAKQGRREIS